MEQLNKKESKTSVFLMLGLALFLIGFIFLHCRFKSKTIRFQVFTVFVFDKSRRFNPRKFCHSLWLESWCRWQDGIHSH